MKIVITPTDPPRYQLVCSKDEALYICNLIGKGNLKLTSGRLKTLEHYTPLAKALEELRLSPTCWDGNFYIEGR